MLYKTLLRTILFMLCIGSVQIHSAENITWESVCNNIHRFLLYRVPAICNTTWTIAQKTVETGQKWCDQAYTYCTDHADEIRDNITPYMTRNTAIGAAAATGAITIGKGIHNGWHKWNVAAARKNTKNIKAMLWNSNLTELRDIYTLPLEEGFSDIHSILIQLYNALTKDNSTNTKDWVQHRFQTSRLLGLQYGIGKETYEEVLAELNALHRWFIQYKELISGICALGNTQYHDIVSRLNQRISDIHNELSNTQREAEEQLGYITQLRRVWNRNNRTIQRYSLNTLSIPRVAALGGIGYLWYRYGSSVTTTLTQ